MQVADLRALQRAAWLKVASDEGLPFPRLENHVYDITPERAIMQVGLLAGCDHASITSMSHLRALR